MNIKESLLLLLLTLVMGYFLGIIISSTVDHKLNDIVINLPKNNIIYKSSNKIKKVKNNNNIEKDTLKRNIDKSEKKNKETENEPENEPDNEPRNEPENETVNEKGNQIVNETGLNNKGNNEIQYDIEDDNIKMYNLSYENNRNFIEDREKFRFDAFNNEEQEQLYSGLY